MKLQARAEPSSSKSLRTLGEPLNRRALRFALAIAAAAGLADAQDPGWNRLSLTTGADLEPAGFYFDCCGPRSYLDVVQTPYVWGDPNSGDYSGDAYYKVFPSYALQRCDGTGATNFLTGLEWFHFDQDWANETTLWAQLFGGAVADASGHLVPDMTGLRLDEVSPSGLPAITTCPVPGQVSGYVLQSFFYDSFGDPLDPGFVVPAETGGHYGPQSHLAISTFAPAPNAHTSSDLDEPLLNSCFQSGDASFGWMVSTGGGAKEADWLGDGLSAYGGFAVGSGVAFSPPEWQPYPIGDAGAISIFLDDPVLEPVIDVGTGFGEEYGMGSLQMPIGYNTGGASTSGALAIGFTVRNSDVISDGTDFAFVDYNLIRSNGVELWPLPIDFGICDHTSSLIENPDALFPGNPLDGLGQITHGVWLINTSSGPWNEESEGTSEMIPLIIPWPATTALANAQLATQGYSINAITGVGVGTQVWRHTFRYDDGCPLLTDGLCPF